MSAERKRTGLPVLFLSPSASSRVVLHRVIHTSAARRSVRIYADHDCIDRTRDEVRKSLCIPIASVVAGCAAGSTRMTSIKCVDATGTSRLFKHSRGQGLPRRSMLGSGSNRAGRQGGQPPRRRHPATFPRSTATRRKPRDSDRRQHPRQRTGGRAEELEKAKKDLGEQEADRAAERAHATVARSAAARFRSACSLTTTRWPCTSAISRRSRKKSAKLR